MIRAAAAAVAIALAFAVPAGESGPLDSDRIPAPPGRGFERLESQALDPADPRLASPRILHSQPPIYRIDAAGFPEISPAGFLALQDSGEGFFHASTLPDRRKGDLASGRAEENRFGDIEGFRRLRRVIRRFRALHPAGPRLGIDDVSSRFGGFPDFNGDGASDHFSHQLGMNFNVLLPSNRVPEVEVHIGRRNEDAFDRRLAIDLVAALVAEGAATVTTSAGTGLLDRPKDLPFAVGPRERLDPNTECVAILGTRARIVLLEPPASHGNHVNAWFFCDR